MSTLKNPKMTFTNDAQNITFCLLPTFQTFENMVDVACNEKNSYFKFKLIGLVNVAFSLKRSGGCALLHIYVHSFVPGEAESWATFTSLHSKNGEQERPLSRVAHGTPCSTPEVWQVT